MNDNGRVLNLEYDFSCDESVLFIPKKPVLSEKLIRSVEKDLMRAFFGNQDFFDKASEINLESSLNSGTTTSSITSKNTGEKTSISIETLSGDTTSTGQMAYKSKANDVEVPSFCDICCGNHQMRTAPSAGPVSMYSVCFFSLFISAARF